MNAKLLNFKTLYKTPIVFVWSQKMGANKNNRTKEYGICQNKDYVGEATCWSSNWL